jgi:hypothetical protein
MPQNYQSKRKICVLKKFTFAFKYSYVFVCLIMVHKRAEICNVIKSNKTLSYSMLIHKYN